MAEPEPILRVDELDAYYGSAHVVQGVSLTIGRECLAVMGRNGAGKTTLARAIMGLAPPRVTGRVALAGRDLTSLDSVARSRAGLGYAPQGRRLFPSLTVAEHLRVAARPGTGDGWDLDRVFALFPSLAARRSATGDRISGGERSMLAIGRALVTNPRCLILDEPTEGLAPAVLERVCQTLRDLVGQGVSILLIEQSLRAVEAAADRVLFLNVGRNAGSFAIGEIGSNRNAIEEMLGVRGSAGAASGRMQP